MVVAVGAVTAVVAATGTEDVIEGGVAMTVEMPGGGGGAATGTAIPGTNPARFWAFAIPAEPTRSPISAATPATRAAIPSPLEVRLLLISESRRPRTMERTRRFLTAVPVRRMDKALLRQLSKTDDPLGLQLPYQRVGVTRRQRLVSDLHTEHTRLGSGHDRGIVGVEQLSDLR